jgi:CubicO group peptidase (beta-lactamase class C family)
MTTNPTADSLRALLEEGLEQRLFSGASAGVSSRRGRTEVSVGTHAYDDPQPVDRNSLFDLASLTKTVTATVVLQLAQAGHRDLDEPVAQLVPLGDGPGADKITLRMLLLHVSGYPADSFLWKEPSIAREERLTRVLATPLESAPDEVYRYSCLGYIAAGAVAERATGASLADLVDDLVARPLGLDSLSFGPVDREAAVATEQKSWVDRGMVRGEVHDELSQFLGARVGNAGLFATAADVLTFSESLRDHQLLGGSAHDQMVTDGLEARHGAPHGQGIGPRINDPEFLGGVDGYGHIGFTGTMWFVAPGSGVAALLLTNRVHPRRELVDLAAFRQRFASWAVSV